MWFATIILNLLHLVSPYNYVRSDSALVSSCSTLINSCNRDTAGKCDRLYHTYYLDCKDELDNTQSNSCSRKCKRAFKALLKHPTFSRERFQNCDCQGENANFCVKQKCKLITSCLGGECRDQITATTPSQKPPVVSTFSSTPSGHSITMSSSTVALGKVNCETVIAHCDKKNDCSLLLKSRDRSCSGFTVQNQHCTPECAQANQFLKDNFVGQHMTTCKFETPSHETTRFSNLIVSCLPREPVQTQSPTYRTEHPSRPVGDCKRQFLECNNDEDCHRGYNKVMKECKRKISNDFVISTCNSKCVKAVGQFRNLAQGSALWSCSCTGQLASRRCDIIKHTFSDICSSEPCADVAAPDECETCARTNSCNSDCGLLCKKSCDRCPESRDSDGPTTDGPSDKPQTLSTMDETVATSQPTPTGSEPFHVETIRTPPSKKIMKFYKVNVTCEDYMNVRIDYSAEIDYSPHFTAEDKSCKMAASPPGSRTATLRLKYNPPDCGTKVVKPHASDTHYRVMRNRIYVRSVAGSDDQRDPIQEIECRVPYTKPDQKNTVETQDNMEMSFYSDSEFRRRFDSFSNEVDDDVLYLGGNKTVYVEVKSTDNSSFILETCFATPNGNEEYAQRYYFIENGCKKDDSFNMIDFIPGNKTRFSFYRIMFSDNKYSGRVYVHCNIRFCDRTDPDCRVNNCRTNEMDMFEKLSVSQGPYTYALSNALSRVARTTHSFFLLSLSSLLILSLR